MERLEQLNSWIKTTAGISDYTLVSASEDASFRRYFRLQYDNKSYIIMDAPPDHENCLPFIDIAMRLRNAGVNVPVVMQNDLEQGFLLITDFGTALYLHELSDNNADALYDDAINSIVCMQKHADTDGLPLYDETLLRNEMQLFPDWLLSKHLAINLPANQQKELQKIFDLLIKSALSQPRVFVHRDFHSRNLMYCRQNNPGIIDFQDAVLGPVTYDLVSLLKDAYIKWPSDRIDYWARLFYETIENRKADHEQFMRWFDLMGVQRHLKVGGIFARLNHRDNKPGFLKDIPRTLSYITDLDREYPELKFLIELIELEIKPKLEKANRKCAQ